MFHGFEDPDIPICLQARYGKGPVRIGAESWLGFGVKVMSGVSIGRHCVIGAGSVVTADIPDYSVAAGVPARVIKRYDPASGLWVRV